MKVGTNMDKELVCKILGLLDTGHEAIQYFENSLKKNEVYNSDLILLDDISHLITSVESTIALQNVLPNRILQINENINYYIEKMKRTVFNDFDEFLFDFRFHFQSLYKILEYEIAYIVEDLIDKTKYPRFYPEVGKVDHEEILNFGKTTPVKVSVVLLAYNNLNYTKPCLESILQCTNDVDYELILVDNGSTDGTLDYFRTIKSAKVLYLPYNLHLVKGFNLGLMAAEGKYTAAVCNDFIFAPNWLSNLVICMESDSTIGFSAPGATSISNMQQIDAIPFHSANQFIEDALKFNISNPIKWEERVVLLPNVLCSPTALLKRIGFYDTRFFRGEFLDDDISFRIRRSGYKLVYCADTVVHHYGSITTNSDHMTNSLEEGRKTFQQKYGLDAWNDARMNPFYQQLDYSSMAKVKSVLGINAKCGATLLQIKNKLYAHTGVAPEVYAITSEEKYLEDLQSISVQSWGFSDYSSLAEYIGRKFDLIYLEEPLDTLAEDLDSLFASLSRLLTHGGHLLFSVNNSVNIESWYQMLSSSHAVHNRRIFIHDLLCSQAAAQGFNPVSSTMVMSEREEGQLQAIYSLANYFFGSDESNLNHAIKMLQTTAFYYQMQYIKPVTN